MSEDGMDKSR
jgi:Rps23 Pro-64 3,4-dihydroxylase Tpa1-like proline 4-hydroxylase